jgi:hypothetical protein
MAKDNAKGDAPSGQAATATKRRMKRKSADGATRRDFEHHRIDDHDSYAPAGPKDRLGEDQRVLLGDLFAVVEEHAEDAAEPVDRELVTRSAA